LIFTLVLTFICYCFYSFTRSIYLCKWAFKHPIPTAKFGWGYGLVPQLAQVCEKKGARIELNNPTAMAA
jgi:hypothetical protein